MSTIAYDKPVKDLISQLNSTGHVTHTSYKKTSVTIHHNGGRLSHEGVLNVWKTRPASAHFDVDSKGDVAQYVKANEYAWAVGNLKGNQTSISIEQANSTLSPTWEVAEVTWKSAARLAGWLFAHVVDGHPRPSKSNLFYHHHWSSTDCAGPYMDKIYDKVLAAAQSAYDSFKGSGSKPAPKPSKTKEPLSKIVDEVIAGEWGNNPQRARDLTAAGYNSGEVQKAVNDKLDGKSSPSSSDSSTPSKRSVESVARAVIAGKYGNGPARVRNLIAAGYNAAEVQEKVDELLKSKRGPKDFKHVADEVIRGKWGDGDERVKKLRAAGYDPSQVQRVVNRLMRR